MKKIESQAEFDAAMKDLKRHVANAQAAKKAGNLDLQIDAINDANAVSETMYPYLKTHGTSRAAAVLGRAGTGKAKARTHEQCRKAQAASVAARAKNKTAQTPNENAIFAHVKKTTNAC